MNQSIKNFFLVVFAPFLLFSCENTKKDQYVSLDGYDIKESQILKDQRIGRTSLIFDVTAFNVLSLTPTWGYKFGKITVFESDCLFKKEEMFSFMNKESNITSFEEQEYKIEDTDFYSYSKKENASSYGWHIDFDTSSLNGKYALYYVADLRKYTITPKDGRNSFEVYQTCNSPSLEFLPVLTMVE